MENCSNNILYQWSEMMIDDDLFLFSFVLLSFSSDHNLQSP